MQQQNELVSFWNNVALGYSVLKNIREHEAAVREWAHQIANAGRYIAMGRRGGGDTAPGLNCHETDLIRSLVLIAINARATSPMQLPGDFLRTTHKPKPLTPGLKYNLACQQMVRNELLIKQDTELVAFLDEVYLIGCNAIPPHFIAFARVDGQ